MKKFLAILKDSLREAVDTKVFYVMLALSGLMILFIGSVSFKPRPGKDAFTFVARASLTAELRSGIESGQMDLLQIFMTAQQLKSGTQIVSVTQLDETRPHNSRYRLIVKMTDSNAEEKLKNNFGRLGRWKMVEVSNVKPLQQNEYEIVTSPTSSTRLVWPHETYALFGVMHIIRGPGVPLGYQLFIIERLLIVGAGGWITLILSVIITAFFVPNMLRKGSIDLLLVKPISRPGLLIHKYFGGLLFILINTLVAIAGVWLVLGLRSGIWAPGLLLTIFSLTFYFAILYSVSVLFSVLTESPIAAILMTCLIYIMLKGIGWGYDWVEVSRSAELAEAKKAKMEPPPEGIFAGVIRAVHAILPRTGDLGNLNSQMLESELLTSNELSGAEVSPITVSWGESIGVSLAFICIMLGLASWRFAKKDY